MGIHDKVGTDASLAEGHILLINCYMHAYISLQQIECKNKS